MARMADRLWMGALFCVGALACVASPALGELREAAGRPGVFEIGEPMLVSRAVLRREMRINSELREYIGLYGYPDYVEVQELQVEEPFAPYEIRVYYLRRERQLAFGHVSIAPSIRDYGVRKYDGPIDTATLSRLLTAAHPVERHAEPDLGSPMYE